MAVEVMAPATPNGVAPSNHRQVDKKKRRKKKKSAKDANAGADEKGQQQVDSQMGQAAVKIEYVSEDLDSEMLQAFGNVFEKFVAGSGAKEEAAGAHEVKPAADGDEDQNEENEEKTSRKKRKRDMRMTVADLKKICKRPELVEDGDQNARDPWLLHSTKCLRNTVPVPAHWREKRKYLSGKKGLEKTRYTLPSFITDTGIQKLREAYAEKEDAKKLKQKQRERMQPKMGKMDIDYQVLHDAFFKYQTKPKLTRFGEMYYEGKEYECRCPEWVKPGELSRGLKAALGINDNSPLPWLTNMLRHGPPPTLPGLRIAGLNAPLPPGAHYDGVLWKPPPVDQYTGHPLYGGNPWGQQLEVPQVQEEVDKRHWGDLEEDEGEEEEEEEEEEQEGALKEGEEEEGGEQQQQQEEEAEDVAMEMEEAPAADGFESTLGLQCETPDVIELRKSSQQQQQKAQAELYQVLEQKEQSAAVATLLGSTHTYQVPAATAAATAPPDSAAPPAVAAPPTAAEKRGKKAEENFMKAASMVPSVVAKKVETSAAARGKQQQNAKVEVSLRPEELDELDDKAIAAKFSRAEEEKRMESSGNRENLSDMVVEQARKQRHKEEKKRKEKEKFKF